MMIEVQQLKCDFKTGEYEACGRAMLEMAAAQGDEEAARLLAHDAVHTEGSATAQVDGK